MGTPPSAHLVAAADRRVHYGTAVTVWETIAVFVLIPLAIYGVLALLTLRQKFAGKARYRPGGSWDYEPVWWTGNPRGIGATTTPAPTLTSPAATSVRQNRPVTRGGARGSW